MNVKVCFDGTALAIPAWRPSSARLWSKALPRESHCIVSPLPAVHCMIMIMIRKSLKTSLSKALDPEQHGLGELSARSLIDKKVMFVCLFVTLGIIVVVSKSHNFYHFSCLPSQDEIRIITDQTTRGVYHFSCLPSSFKDEIRIITDQNTREVSVVWQLCTGHSLTLFLLPVRWFFRF